MFGGWLVQGRCCEKYDNNLLNKLKSVIKLVFTHHPKHQSKKIIIFKVLKNMIRLGIEAGTEGSNLDDCNHR